MLETPPKPHKIFSGGGMGVFWFALWVIIAVTIYLTVAPSSWVDALMAIIIASVTVILID